MLEPGWSNHSLFQEKNVQDLWADLEDFAWETHGGRRREHGFSWGYSTQSRWKSSVRLQAGPKLDAGQMHHAEQGQLESFQSEAGLKPGVVSVPIIYRRIL